MTRALLIVLDSVGIGGAPDARAFGDEGADTLGHIAEQQSFFNLPNLDRLGLGHAARLASGRRPRGLDANPTPAAAWGCAQEISHGKDTPSGHWEIAGAPVLFDWGYFPRTIPAFPEDLTRALIREASLSGILGNRHAPGTDIIRDLGKQHIRSGKPICYTSTDSVFQIAAHETHFGLERLYETCLVARRLTVPLNIGRVIARPFVGETADTFRRTGNRRDYAVPPPGPTLLDHASEAGRRVFAIGKIADIFAHRGTTDVRKADGNNALLDAALKALDEAGDGDLVFVNLIDFDQLHGHRRDVSGYAAALEAFDSRIPDIETRLKPGDLCVITADHGNDPTWPGTDHTREQVPILAFGPGIAPRFLGRRKSFADIGQTLAMHLGLAPPGAGTSFL